MEKEPRTPDAQFKARKAEYPRDTSTGVEPGPKSAYNAIPETVINITLDLPPGQTGVREEEVEVHEQTQEAYRPTLQTMPSGSVGRFMKRALLALGITALTGTESGSVGAHSEQAQEQREVFSPQQAIFEKALNEYDVPGLETAKPDPKETLSLNVHGESVELSRETFEHLLGRALAMSSAEPYMQGKKVLYDWAGGTVLGFKDAQNYPVIDPFMLDTLYKIHPKDGYILDAISNTTARERKELGHILIKDAYAALPKNASGFANFDIRGEALTIQYIPDTQRGEFFRDRFDDVAYFTIDILRTFHWDEIPDKDRASLRTISAWLVRSQMDFSAVFVQITDHVTYPDEQKKRELLFEPLESWEGKQIDPVLQKVADARTEFTSAIQAARNLAKRIETFDEQERTHLLQVLDGYEQTYLIWQTETIARLFEDRAKFDDLTSGIKGKESAQWNQWAQSARTEGVDSLIKKG